MRPIKRMVVHCTDTPSDTKLSSIMNYWLNERKWNAPGYHFIVDENGNCIQLLDIEDIANGARGFNSGSIHFAYIGRIPNKKQLETLKEEIDYWQKRYKVPVMGHRDLPNVNKTCPNFDVHEWYYGNMPR